MCAACASWRPSSSKTAQEKSRRSLMFGENALRRSFAPISSAMPLKRCWKTSTETGSGDPSLRRTSFLPQRLVQVAPEIVDVLQADRQADAPGTDAGIAALRLREARVRRQRRQTRERLTAAEARRSVEELQAIEAAQCRA